MTINPDAPARRLQQSYEIMLDSLLDEVIQLDDNGYVLTWNRGAERLKGWTAEEAIGQHVSAFYTDEDVRGGLAERELRNAGEAGRYETEGWRIRKDGSRFWASIVITAMRDPNGELLGFVKMSRDQTERRAADELIRRQRDEILELSTPVIQVWDRVLALPIIGTLDSNRAGRLTEGLLAKIADLEAEFVILDISGVPTIDTQVAQHLLKTVHAARLMGATSILSGVRPETAQAMVHLGIELGTLRSRNTLRDALQLALQMISASSNGVVRHAEALTP
ncbi:MAG TPA: PAS domain S-box protein [Candidatus Angelobacter sp.]|nr:PAS domain S-box protein [Candidatus Angelobacter sp.]